MDEQGYTPTVADEALMASMQAVHVAAEIQQAYVNGEISRPAYDKLYPLAARADKQVRHLADRLEAEQSGSSKQKREGE